MAKRIIYSNVFTNEAYNDAMHTLICNGNENPSCNDIFDEMAYENDFVWEHEIGIINDFLCNKVFILFGTEKRWNGVRCVFDIVSCIDDIMEMLRECDEIEIYDENGHMYFYGTHHDGSVRLELRELNERGITYYEKWYNSLDDKRTEQYIGKMLRTDNYSKLPHYYEKVLGTK